MLSQKNAIRGICDDPARSEIDRRHRRAGEGQESGVLLSRALDFQKVTGTVIEHGFDLAQLFAAGVKNAQTDQIGMVEFVIGQRGQQFAPRKEPCAFQRVGLLFGGNAVYPRGKAALDRAVKEDCKAARAASSDSGQYWAMSEGVTVKLLRRISPLTPNAPAMAPTQMRSSMSEAPVAWGMVRAKSCRPDQRFARPA